jgi:hypothetical protein
MAPFPSPHPCFGGIAHLADPAPPVHTARTMTDKDRQRQRGRLAPHGRLPNWLLVVVAGAVSAAAAVLAGTL